MKQLRIIKAKPNPTGKDRNWNFVPPKQLAAEWLDFKNVGTEPHPLEDITLNHRAYQPGCCDPKWDVVMTFRGSLRPGEVLRVHSGRQLSPTEMYPEDSAGADHHLFIGRDRFVWNNACGDTAGLWNGAIWLDLAGYDPYPPEGRIIVRDGDKLVP